MNDLEMAQLISEAMAVVEAEEEARLDAGCDEDGDFECQCSACRGEW